jgi:hypothetical protein
MVSSPCINVCTVEDGVCTACNRTLADIAGWSQMTEQERIERMRDLKTSLNNS